MARACRETRDKSQPEIEKTEEHQKRRRMLMILISFHEKLSTKDTFLKLQKFANKFVLCILYKFVEFLSRPFVKSLNRKFYRA